MITKEQLEFIERSSTLRLVEIKGKFPNERHGGDPQADALYAAVIDEIKSRMETPNE